MQVERRITEEIETRRLKWYGLENGGIPLAHKRIERAATLKKKKRKTARRLVETGYQRQ